MTSGLIPPTPADAETVASPCVRNCCLDDAQICLGCGRSLDEIRDWSAASNDEKRKILACAAARRAARAQNFALNLTQKNR